MKTFVDQSAWIALVNPQTPVEIRVAKEFERALSEGDRLFTHNIAIGNAMSEIKKQNGAIVSNKFYEIVDAAYSGAHLSMLWIGRRTQKEAVWLMKKHSSLDLDLYDYACFILMRRRRLRTILTSKPDYKQLQLSVIPEPKE